MNLQKAAQASNANDENRLQNVKSEKIVQPPVAQFEAFSVYENVNDNKENSSKTATNVQPKQKKKEVPSAVLKLHSQRFFFLHFNHFIMFDILSYPFSESRRRKKCKMHPPYRLRCRWLPTPACAQIWKANRYKKIGKRRRLKLPASCSSTSSNTETIFTNTWGKSKYESGR